VLAYYAGEFDMLLCISHANRRLVKHRWIWIAAFFLSCCGLSVSAPGQTVREHEVKAVFLYNFGKFVKWPHDALPKNASLIIGIADSTAFGDAFSIIEGKKAQNHTVEIKYNPTVEEMASCHILLLNYEDDLMTKIALTELAGLPILTVGEREGFIRWGGMMRFYMRNNTVRIEANPKAAESAKLKLSAKLLEVSKIVER
jgi:hypothetical protein